ncbi:lactadherin-like [Actinia tenebrosa]|uniref:Lactadherin-like n=1 Tax=Actinia tenebrosa TaxID=6105 RepID=A0A6P8I0X8_ACTTE|nr:lactadherin-like [Actinia tenebrosa]XP_031561191.1 lactadherin-like [Actinia tenebrosa]
MQYVVFGILLTSLLTGQIILDPVISHRLHHGCQNVSSVANYKLEGHVFDTIYGKNFETCVISCEDDKRCLSLNYKHVTRACELNTRSKSTNPCDLVPRDGVVYMDSLKHYTKDACALFPCKNGVTCLVTSCCRGFKCDCGVFYTGEFCEDCTLLGEPLGMKSKAIPDAALQASSYRPGYPPSNGRLDDDKGWISSSNDVMSPYFQVNLKETKSISRVCLQGTNISSFPNGGAWIKQLYFSFSLDGSNWTDYITQDGHKHLQGCTTVEGKKFFNFTNPMQAKYVQIRPVTWEQFPALRMELYGCEANLKTNK